MKQFPGKIAHGGGNHRQVILNDEQMEWFRTEYPKTESPRLAKVMGCSVETVRKLARLNGLSKSEDGMKAIRKRQGKRMAKTFEKLGYYNNKRDHAPSEATIEGNRKRWAEIRAGLRETPQETAKRKHPKKWKASLKKRSENRRKMIKQEKRRIIYGLERKTNLKVVVMKPYTRSQLHHRCNALKRGYLLDTNCSEGQPGRYVIYYDDETERSEKFEQNCIKDGFTFRRDE